MYLDEERNYCCLKQQFKRDPETEEHIHSHRTTQPYCISHQERHFPQITCQGLINLLPQCLAKVTPVDYLTK